MGSGDKNPSAGVQPWAMETKSPSAGVQPWAMETKVLRREYSQGQWRSKSFGGSIAVGNGEDQKSYDGSMSVGR